MKAIFIAGTDTGVGKTVIAGLLGRHLLKEGYRVATQKWVQTGAGKIGTAPYFSDIDIHLNLMGSKRADHAEVMPHMAPYEFKLAASPHLASRAEGRRISEAVIRRSFAALSKQYDYVIVEGSGGLLVPIGPKTLMIDIVRRMRLPVLLVAGNRLGAINSTLLSIEALRSRRMKITGVVFNNNLNDQDRIVLKDNPKIVNSITGVEVFGTLAYSPNLKMLHKNFARIGKRLAGKI